MAIVVHEDGIVDYEGTMYVKIEGKHRYRIGMDRVRALSEAFEEARFSSFDASYHSTWSEPTPVQVTHRGKAVSHHLDAENAPLALTQLEEDFDRIVGAEEWIGTEKEREVFRGRRGL
jgi:hypothetical protein